MGIRVESRGRFQPGYDPRRNSYESVREQLEAHIERIPFTTCWIWIGASYRTYGQVRIGGASGKAVFAHRASYEEYNGPIPNGFVVDHSCREHACVNPLHLEAVTNSENHKRAPYSQTLRDKCAAITHCPKGHEYTKANTSVRTQRGYSCRSCRQCDRERAARNRAKGKA